jgi:3-hydroxyacyl-[acyl-carrier-protein] dehydratase
LRRPRMRLRSSLDRVGSEARAATISAGCACKGKRSCSPRPASRTSHTVTADEQTRHSATLRVPADHPALTGHFPGNPVVPGVVILDAVISAAESWLGASFDVASISHAKFLAPLKPDEAARIRLVLRASSLEFVVDRDEATIAKGTLIGTTRTTP